MCLLGIVRVSSVANHINIHYTDQQGNVTNEDGSKVILSEYVQISSVKLMTIQWLTRMQ